MAEFVAQGKECIADDELDDPLPLYLIEGLQLWLAFSEDPRGVTDFRRNRGLAPTHLSRRTQHQSDAKKACADDGQSRHVQIFPGKQSPNAKDAGLVQPVWSTPPA